MKTTISRWGNSLALRVPRAVAEDAGLGEGVSVDLKVEEGTLMVRPVRGRRPALDALIEGIKPSNIHPETSTGAPRGREAW